jgi:glycosyltransferase involved in cell wall biosynthesis
LYASGVQPLRILNIIQCTNLGGMERASLRLMIGLKERGHSCELLSLNPLGALRPLLFEAGIPAVGLAYRGPWGLLSAQALRRTLKSSAADALIMTGHNLLAMLALGDICKGRRLLAIHFHHSGVKPSWHWRLIYAAACRKFQAMTFASNYIRREAQAIYPPIASRSHTVRNPLPLPPLPTAAGRRMARTALGFSTSTKLIGNAGWLIERKRFDVFLMVAQHVVRKRRDAFFLIAGDGPERPRLQSLAERLQIADRVFWLGWRENLAEFYSALDVLLFNTDDDAFPTTPLEAMSHGIPVVASARNGGLAEVISDGCYGYLIPQHDVDSMAKAVLNFLDRDNRALGELARARVASLCSTERIADEVEALLLDLGCADDHPRILSEDNRAPAVGSGRAAPSRVEVEQIRQS